MNAHCDKLEYGFRCDKEAVGYLDEEMNLCEFHITEHYWAERYEKEPDK